MALIVIEQIRLMMDRRHKPQERDADAHRFRARHVVPKLSQSGEQKTGILGLGEAGLVPPVAEIAHPAKMNGEPASIIFPVAQALRGFGQKMLRVLLRALGGTHLRLKYV